jgi:hypothetical protein
MDAIVKTSIWQQFGATIDMLDDALNACPDALWTASLWKDSDGIEEYSQFWFIVYHTLFWLDLYLTGVSENFAPPPPFKRGVLPEKPYTKDQLHTYLLQCRRKCQTTIEALTDDQARQPCKFEWGEANFLELQLYNLRHVQEHASQLNFLLGRNEVLAPDWVTRARESVA